LATKNGSRLIIDGPADLRRIHADQIRFWQSLLNLASNAYKFTEKGTITIATRQGQENGHDWVTVADTGIGMTPEQMAKLFHLPGRFLHHPQIRRYRPWPRDQQTLLPDDGRRHHELGRGSTFTIRLPRIVDAPKEVAAANPTHTGVAALKPH
jgi:signal transduction histidine kinase